MADNIKICKSAEADAAEVLKLQYAAYQSEAELYNDFNIQPLTQTLDELVAEYKKGVVLKAVLDGEIIGSVRAYAEGGTVYISKLIVHPDHQGKGLGRRLLSNIERMLTEKRFELFTGAKSERNLRLYEKAGYKRFREETSESGPTLVYLEKKADNGSNMALGLCIGVLAGAALDFIFGDSGYWMPVGLGFGLAFGGFYPQIKSKLFNGK